MARSAFTRLLLLTLTLLLAASTLLFLFNLSRPHKHLDHTPIKQLWSNLLTEVLPPGKTLEEIELKPGDGEAFREAEHEEMGLSGGMDVGGSDGSAVSTLLESVTVRTLSPTSFGMNLTTQTELPVADVVANQDLENIHRDFEKFEAPEEDFEPFLKDEDRAVIGGLKVGEAREERIKRLYNLRGEKNWWEFMESLPDDDIPPLTKFTQKYINAHQFPATCADKQFLLMSNNYDRNGLGTVVHGVGFILALGLRHNRILIYDTQNAPGEHFIEAGCKGKTMDCIFLPITNCTMEHVTKENSIAIKHYWDPPKELVPAVAFPPNYPPGAGINNPPKPFSPVLFSGTVPPVLGAAMKKVVPGIMPDALKYWWRVQAAGYVMRLNSEGMARVQELRMNKTMHVGVHEGQIVDVPYPLPRGCFSMHVRHGDKGIEMQLIPLKTYITLAESYTALNPLLTTKCAFLSTENPSLLPLLHSTTSLSTSPTTSTKSWTFFYSLIPRINGSPKEQLEKFGNRTEMTLKWMEEMMMAGEAEVPVGTRGSGWNRMIDEVRCVWGGCRQAFIEVGVEVDWSHYNYKK